MTKLFYERPVTESVTLHTEGLICDSGDWYEQEGQGNFNFGIENDPLFG